jgi:hypothetical protein
VGCGRLRLTGNEAIKAAMQQWLGLSPFAAEKKRVPTPSRAAGGPAAMV